MVSRRAYRHKGFVASPLLFPLLQSWPAVAPPCRPHTSSPPPHQRSPPCSTPARRIQRQRGMRGEKGKQRGTTCFAFCPGAFNTVGPTYVTCLVYTPHPPTRGWGRAGSGHLYVVQTQGSRSQSCMAECSESPQSSHCPPSLSGLSTGSVCHQPNAVSLSACPAAPYPPLSQATHIPPSLLSASLL